MYPTPEDRQAAREKYEEDYDRACNEATRLLDMTEGLELSERPRRQMQREAHTWAVLAAAAAEMRNAVDVSLIAESEQLARDAAAT